MCIMIPMLCVVVAALIIFFAFVKLYIRMHCGCFISDTRLDGKTVIITGANTGIGLETAKDIARRGARLILACRNMEKAAMSKEIIIQSTGNVNIVLKQIDLSNTHSVRKFASDVLKTEPRLDILINNAGLSGNKRRITEEGLEFTMASNHFGGFLLTNLLLGLLKQSAPSRVIVVSSFLHRVAKLDVSDLNAGSDTGINGQESLYCRSKLANVLFAKELARRVKGTGVSVYAVHPGVCQSDIWENFSFPMNKIWFLLGKMMFKTSKEGAQTSLYCAVSDEVEGKSGKYFKDCREVTPSKAAQNAGLAKKVWDESERLVKLQLSEKHF